MKEKTKKLIILRDHRGRFIKGNQIRLGSTFKSSESTKKKISNSLKKAYKGGRRKSLSEMFSKEKNPFYGKKHSKEAKEVMSKLKLGKETWNKGKKMPNQSGKNHRYYGKHLSKEHRMKISLSGRGRKGLIYSKETREKQSKIQKILCNTPERIAKAKERRAKQVFPIKDTKIEVKIQNFLKRLGIEFFTHQYMKEIEHGYQCDVLIPSMNLVIECDGDYWHKYPVGLEKDHIRTRELIDKGFKVLRLWERDINELKMNQFKSILKKQ